MAAAPPALHPALQARSRGVTCPRPRVGGSSASGSVGCECHGSVDSRWTTVHTCTGFFPALRPPCPLPPASLSRLRAPTGRLGHSRHRSSPSSRAMDVWALPLLLPEASELAVAPYCGDGGDDDDEAFSDALDALLRGEGDGSVDLEGLEATAHSGVLSSAAPSPLRCLDAAHEAHCTRCATRAGGPSGCDRPRLGQTPTEWDLCVRAG